MSSITPNKRLDTIYQKIVFIEEIIHEYNSITKALNDEKLAKPSILMHLIAIAEQFNKLKEENEFEILTQFDKSDLKGSYDIRNFIAHDYEGVNLMIVEKVLREKLPKLKNTIEQIRRRLV
ncbi:MAG: hypothetical protein KU38_03370 [Sulfurovum sp. FS08-3]|nr:MAG: hypothetical protein KU38_03370 [Sulfurovum sp. FS08-3]